MAQLRITPIKWDDQPLREVAFPSRKLQVRHGIGSGLCRDPDDPAIVWAIADRGPNLELETAVEDYGWALAHKDAPSEAKVMPCLDLGPYIARLRLHDNEIRLERQIRLTDQAGEPVPGVPTPDCLHSRCEPAFAFEGGRIDPRPSGMDSEGIAVLVDGGFWIGEEYGPSLVRVDPDGRVARRLMPHGSSFDAGAPEVEASLPALAARRHLNRGFEAVAMPPSGDRIYLAFQSPLAHPDREAFERARHVRIWELDGDGQVLGQFLYPFDDPRSFRADAAERKIGWKDLKVCELACPAEGELLVLERCVRTSKIYRVHLAPDLRTPAAHLVLETRPTIEELSGSGRLELPVLDKTQLFDSADFPEVSSDIEGMAILSESSLLIVSDNDFGVLDKETRFFRLDFDQPLRGTT